MQTFVTLMLADILETPNNPKKCLIVDNKLIPDAAAGFELDNFYGDEDSFLRELAAGLQVSCTPAGFRSRNFYIFAQHQGDYFDQYVDIFSGDVKSFSELVSNGITTIRGRGVTFSTGTDFYGVMQWGTNSNIIDYFKEFKDDLGEENFKVYAKWQIEIIDNEVIVPPTITGEYGLNVKYYKDGYSAFENRTI